MLFSMISAMDNTLGKTEKDILSLLSLFMSAFVAAFSVYEGSKRYEVRSENFLRSARLLHTIRDKLTVDYLSGKLTWETCKKYEEEYFSILDSHSDNHANIDYQAHRLNTGNVTVCELIFRKSLQSFELWWLFIFSLLSPSIVFLIYKLTITAPTFIKNGAGGISQ